MNFTPKYFHGTWLRNFGPDRGRRGSTQGLMELHLPDVRVDPFESPRLALARFAKQEVSTVVSDLKMNELDGFALLRGAKALRPFILFSGHVDAALAAQAIDMGAHDVLQKPFHREEFLTVLTLALNTYDLAREVRLRRLMTERLSKQVEILKRLIAESYQRPNTIKRIQGIISTSRQLKHKSLASLETSLDRLWQHANMAQARLDVAQQHLLAMQQQSRAGFLKRITAGPN
jgi:FixJ family two-component response regulator